MLTLFRHRAFTHLFASQVLALTGTGLLTVALGLLAYDLAGNDAGAVLGMAYTIKMVAYVGLSPIVAALTTHLPRKALLIAMDILRAGVALCLPFVDAVWQIYILIFALQAASATFTPAFQATIPDILPDEATYTRALSLSRLAYDLENLLSPALAGLLLLVVEFHWLFAGTTLGFLLSALLVSGATISPLSGSTQRPFRERAVRGTWIYLKTPRLRGLLAFNFAAAASGAFVLVNTVVVVRGTYHLPETYLAHAMAAFGGGSMLAALTVPRLLDRITDRVLMRNAALALGLFTLALSTVLDDTTPPAWEIFLASWALIGLLYSAILTPSGRLLRRSSHPEDRPAVFTAQFALSHACWLVTYPLAGWVAKLVSLQAALGLLGGLAFLAALVGRGLWPAAQSECIPHEHPDLPADHPHRLAHDGPNGHSHVFIIDDEHPTWPQGRNRT